LILLYSSYGITVLEISVTPTGRVQKVDIIKTSGNPIIDIALKDYFRKCLFEAVSSDETEVAKIKFNLTSGNFDYD